MALTFAGATGATGADKFRSGDWQDDTHGNPRLGSAIATFSCVVREQLDAGTHTVFIGTVTAIATSEGDALVYEQSRFHRLEPV